MIKKVGRNEPCPCGSGKKFKKCHMEVKVKQQIGLLKRVYDTDDDYVHRLLLGVTGIRDCAIADKTERKIFDKHLMSIIQNLTEMKMAAKKCKELIATHSKDVADKKDAIYTTNQITVTYPVDDELSLLFKDIFIRGMMATRCLNTLSRSIGYNIEFMFADEEEKFSKGAKKFPLDKEDKRFGELVSFIKNHKSAWYTAFRNMRVEIEHMGWSLPDVKYQVDSNMRVHAVFPKVEGMEMSELSDLVWRQIVLLCEEIIVFLLSLKLRDEMVIVRLSEEEREKHNKVRYIVSHKHFPGVPLSCS